MLTLQKADELFAQLGTEIGRSVDGGRRDEDAQFDRFGAGICDLHVDELGARLLALSDQFAGHCAKAVNRRGIIQIKEHAADIDTSLPRPVIERLLNEIIERHDQSPLIPQTDDDIGRGDLLDPAVLVLYGDRVFEANWLSHRQLNPGDEVAEAKTLMPYWRTVSNVISAKPKVTSTIMMSRTR